MVVEYSQIFQEQGVTDESVQMCCDIAIARVLINVDYQIMIRVPMADLAQYFIPQMEFESGVMKLKNEQITDKMKHWILQHEYLHTDRQIKSIQF